MVGKDMLDEDMFGEKGIWVRRVVYMIFVIGFLGLITYGISEGSAASANKLGLVITTVIFSLSTILLVAFDIFMLRYKRNERNKWLMYVLYVALPFVWFFAIIIWCVIYLPLPIGFK